MPRRLAAAAHLAPTCASNPPWRIATIADPARPDEKHAAVEKGLRVCEPPEDVASFDAWNDRLLPAAAR